MNKPFDLQKALAGEPVVTKEGQPATYRFTAKNDQLKHKHVFTRTDDKGNEWAVIVDDEGCPSNASSLIVKNAELFMAPKKVQYWVATANTKDSSVVASNPAKQEETAISILKNVWGEDRVMDIQTHFITRFE